MAQILRTIGLLCVCTLMSACGGDDGGPTGPVQVMPPAKEGIPPRTSTYIYQAAFAFDESRSFSGIGYELVHTKTGEVRPDGTPVIVQKAIFADRPNGLFQYDASQRSAHFQYNGVVTTAVDDGSNVQHESTSLLWYDPFAKIPYSISYAGHVPGSGSPYIAYARLSVQAEKDVEVIQTFGGGSKTRSDDLPPRGHDARNYSISAQVLETEDAIFVSGSARGIADFDFGRDEFAIDSASVSFDDDTSTPALELTVSGTIVRNDASLSATVTDKVSGRSSVVMGSCYGPYCEAILLEGLLTAEDGRQIILTIYM